MRACDMVTCVDLAALLFHAAVGIGQVQAEIRKSFGEGLEEIDPFLFADGIGHGARKSEIIRDMFRQLFEVAVLEQSHALLEYFYAFHLSLRAGIPWA